LHATEIFANIVPYKLRSKPMMYRYIKIFVFLSLFLSIFSFRQSEEENYYIVYIQEDIYLNQKRLQVKDSIPADASLRFSSSTAKAIVFSPDKGKFILTANSVKPNAQGKYIAKIKDVLIATLDYFSSGTRAGAIAYVNTADFATSLLDNPLEDDQITIYFIPQKPNSILPVPANLMSEDAYFYLKNATYIIPIPINKENKLVFSKRMIDDKNQTVNILKLKNLEFIYARASPASQYLIGKVKFESF
jgi:hypothetical protein